MPHYAHAVPTFYFVMLRTLAGAFFVLFCVLSPGLNPVRAADTLEADLAYNTAHGMMENKVYDMAREQWEDFLKEYPTDSRCSAARHFLGVCFFQAGDYRNAIPRFSEAAEDRKFELREESVYLEAISNYELAKQLPREGGGAEPVKADSEAGKFYGRAVELFQKILADFPKTRYRTDVMFYQAVSQQQLGQFQEAQKLYEALEREQKTPRDFMLLSFFARAELLLKKQDQAGTVQLLERMLKYYNDTSAAAQAGAEAGTSGFLPENIRLRAMDLLAVVYFSMKNYKNAEQAYGRILADRVFLAAVEQRNSGQEDPVLQDVDVPGIYYNFADLLLKSGSFTRAAAAFEDFRKRFPDTPQTGRALFQQGIALRQENDAEKKAGRAEKHAQQMILALWEDAFRRPEMSQDVTLCNAAGHQLMLAYLEQNEAEQGMEVFWKVAEVNQAHGEALAYSLRKDHADLLAAAGRNGEAVTLYADLVKEFQSQEKMMRLVTACAYQVIYLYEKDQKYAESLAYVQEIMKTPVFAQMPEAYRVAMMQAGAGAAYRMKNFAESDRLYRGLLQAFPRNEAADQWTLSVAHGLQLTEKFAEVRTFLTAQRREQLKTVAAKVEAGHILGFSLMKMAQKATVASEAQQLTAQAESVFKGLIQLLEKPGSENAYPRADILYYDYADLVFGREQYKECMKVLAEIIRKFRESAIQDKVYFLYARCAVGLQNQDVAVKAFQTIIEKYPQSPLFPDALLAVSQCLLSMDRAEEAKKYARQLQEQFPDDRLADSGANVRAVLAMDAGNYDEAAGAWEKILNSQQPELKKLRLDALYGLGVCRMHQKNYGDAESRFRQILQEKPDWPAVDKVVYQLGWALLEQKKTEEAQTFFETLTKKFPKSALVRESLYQLAIYAYRQGRVDEAGATFQKLITENAEDAIAQNARLPLAWMVYKQKKYDTAKEYALAVLTALDVEVAKYGAGSEHVAAEGEKTAESGNAKNAVPQELLANRAELWFLVGQCDYAESRWEDAQRWLTKALESGHLNAVYREDALVALIKMEELKENWPEVQRLCERCLTEFPQTPQRMLLRYKTALALFNQKNEEEAQKRFLEIATEDKGIHAARSLFMLGEILFLKKDYAGAIKRFYQVIYGFEDAQLQADALFEASRCFEALGQKEKADAHFRQLIEKYPASDKVDAAKKKMKE